MKQVVDLLAATAELPAQNALSSGSRRRARVVLRPSGTEPKLKAYLEVATAPVARKYLAEERSRAAEVLGSLERDVSARCQSMSR